MDDDLKQILVGRAVKDAARKILADSGHRCQVRQEANDTLKEVMEVVAELILEEAVARAGVTNGKCKITDEDVQAAAFALFGTR
mmetsp:Transcript_7866/g.20470  ORF Transcript_7866/g.20470 Transcript_7866/m.20470 type:complete len:84 (+) Transcript_7866:151-402(+)|eukprot:CAMPEP_0113871202 /NCGR_PEP_ID=MMETSP0780_2-20120614/2511_1 /TAXON_ID=652834 /ORGANISM="Palpitomonas bilix" /LENGTH=83 /DNA_ID=CAMNT_0000856565 /DNA_START=121 /DNA_END=372 /DNA_ORIENTATION=+ /assembly_acc=CAM_ASM_000599